MMIYVVTYYAVFFFQAEDGIRDLVRSRGLGDVYKRQRKDQTADHSKSELASESMLLRRRAQQLSRSPVVLELASEIYNLCLLYTSDAADERSSVDLGGRRIIKKKNNRYENCINKKATNTRMLMNIRSYEL